MASQYQFIELADVQYWMDECYLIENGELNYGKYIEKDLVRIANIEKILHEMDENTFPLYGGATQLNKFFDYRTIEQIKKDNDTKPLPPRKSGKIATKKE